MIYRMSYLWYCLIGTFVALFVGLLVSFMTKPQNPKDLDPMLLAPFVRRLIGSRKYPNQPEDGIIYAYGMPSVNNHVNNSTEVSDKVTILISEEPFWQIDSKCCLRRSQ